MKDYQLAARLLAQVQKAGARHNAGDNTLIQQAHDILCSLGASCRGSGASSVESGATLSTLHPPPSTLLAAIKAAVKRTPSGTPKGRDYKKEYRDYHGKPEQIKRRAGRNQARRAMVKAGKVKPGDGKDVDHINRDTTDNAPGNLRAMDRSKNRSRK